MLDKFYGLVDGKVQFVIDLLLQFFKCTVRLVTGEKALPFLTNGLRFLPIAIKLSMLSFTSFWLFIKVPSVY